MADAKSVDMKYDLAVSFAGEHRDYVEATVRACQATGLSVFYDRDKNSEWWGQSFIRDQRRVYGSQTRFFVPFISDEYLKKSIPMDEFSAAMMTAVKQGDGYILPVLIGSVQVPAELLHPHIHYLRAEDYSPEELASELKRKVAAAKSSGQEPRDTETVVQQALNVRLPKVVSRQFSKYRELQVTFDYLMSQYQDAVPQLEPQGFIGTVSRTDAVVSVRIERNGRTVYALDITKGGPMGDDKLSFRIGEHSYSTNSSNGYATPMFDVSNQRSVLNMMDFSVLGNLGGTTQYTKEELFNKLWDRLVLALEQAG